MSAICGVVGTDGRPWSTDDLAGVAGALAPLGRDGGGAWSGTAGRCGVAVSAALRHSTPEDAADRQPAQSPDGSLVFVGDVRIDNRPELAPALGLADARSVPDSAFVLAAYERWGEAMLDRLLGDFAFAVVDRRRGGVLLARDHVGAVPLVVHRRRGVVAFASTALALTELEGVGHELDVRRAAEVLALGFCSDRTFVEGVRWVPPAGAIWVDASGVRDWTWWAPDPNATVDLGSAAAYERELRGALDAAVAARLRSAGSVGVLMSGGLDSTSVGATAAQMLAPEALPAYTSVPPPGWRGPERPGWDADESSLVRELAEMHPNLEPRFLAILGGTSLFGEESSLWDLGADPVGNPANALWMDAARRRAHADGVTALLTGQRGNLHFSADGRYWLASLLLSGRVARTVREAGAWRSISGESAQGIVRSHLVVPLLPTTARRTLRRLLRREALEESWGALTALRPEILADLDLPKLLPVLDPHVRHVRAAGLAAAQRLGAEQAGSGMAITAVTGVELRDATSDRRVLETALEQPEWIRRRRGVSRAVIRGAMAQRLPTALVHRTRRGEQLPNWLDVMTGARDELMAEVDALTQHPVSRQLIDGQWLRGLVGAWPDRAACADPTVRRNYRMALLRAIAVSRYLRWFEARNDARVETTGRVRHAAA